MVNPFFKNNGPFKFDEILKELKIDNYDNNKILEISDIKDLQNSNSGEITFLHSKKYKSLANNTKASFCITTNKLENELPQNCKSIIVENVLISTSVISAKFYPDSIIDDFDNTVEEIEGTMLKDKVKFGKNVLIGKNVSIGSNCLIGHNSIIEKNVSIGNNCSIGSNTIIRNTVIKNDVRILDSCIIGKHGFGFFPNLNKNLRYPHIGIVIIEDSCEIGCGSTIDRGSMSNTIIRNTLIKNNVKILDNCVIGKHGFGFFPNLNKNLRYPHMGAVVIEDDCEIGCGTTIDRGSMSNTTIGKNTFLDNQIHIAHNVRIGENSIIAGQVGIAGSSIIGNNVKIGGQAGISGHLKIGNNVEIAGGSGVIKDIPDNSKVMGYPAKNMRDFLRKNR